MSDEYQDERKRPAAASFMLLGGVAWILIPPVIVVMRCLGLLEPEVFPWRSVVHALGIGALACFSAAGLAAISEGWLRLACGLEHAEVR